MNSKKHRMPMRDDNDVKTMQTFTFFFLASKITSTLYEDLKDVLKESTISKLTLVSESTFCLFFMLTFAYLSICKTAVSFPLILTISFLVQLPNLLCWSSMDSVETWRWFPGRQ